MDRIAVRDALLRLASNHIWTYQHRTIALFDALPTAAEGRHPAIAVRDLTAVQLDDLAVDQAFVSAVEAQLAHLDENLATRVTDPDIVYYSPEFGISDVVPQYSGGLGILAGDHLKSASDLRTNLAAVGLFYRHGFFRQYLDNGKQAERIETYYAEDFGFTDTELVVEVPIADRIVFAKVWRMDVGRIPLILLDTDLGENSAHDRAITDQLYGGDRLHRLEQELVLGVGGARAVAAMGWSPGVHHSNEGHAGFLAIELLDRARRHGANDIKGAIDTIKPHVLFTTHTPVPAGIDRFEHSLIGPHLQPWADAWGDDLDDVLALGPDPDDESVFNMAATARSAATCSPMSPAAPTSSRSRTVCTPAPG
jgi:starch phosphorylase